MKFFKTLLALLLVVVMVAGLAACGQKKAEEPTPAEEADGPSEAAESAEAAVSGFGSYTIGHTNLGAGVWILDMYQKNTQHYADELGMTLNPASANFSSDQMVKDIQNQIASGEDGHLYFAAITTLTPTVNEMFEKEGVYWSVFNQMPDERDLETLNANPYYCGAVGSDHVAVAASLGELAAEMGLKKAGLMAGAVGDTSSDLRIQGFTEAFEAGGGEVVAVARCSDPSEAAAKGDDLLAAYGDEIDCFYALNMDYIMAAIHASENYGLDNIMFFSSDCDAEGLEYVRQGKMIAHSNMSTDSVFAMVLVLNALDGHKIVDENGNPPYFTAGSPWIITQETADDYQTYWLDEFPIPMEAMQSMLYRYNPDVSYESLLKIQEDYDYDWVMSFHE